MERKDRGSVLDSVGQATRNATIAAAIAAAVIAGGPARAAGAGTDRFGVGYGFAAITFAAADVGYGANLFYYLRHDSSGFATFGTISTSGAIVDRFGVGYDFDAVTFAMADVGYGPNLFYYLRHDSSGFATFGTISTSGAIVDRFGVGSGFDAITFAAADVGYGANLFYYLRHDSGGFATFGTISASGAIVDRFGVGYGFQAIAFAAPDAGYGPNLFYYLRHDSSGLAAFGSISTSGAVVDRLDVGSGWDAIAFAAADTGYGPNLFYYLRHDSSGFATFGTLTAVQQDTTPPVLTLPDAIEVDATSPMGAVVTYVVSVTDQIDPAPTYACNPVPGATFPIGTTVVQCSAADASGNTTQGSFEILVLGGAEQSWNLAALVDTLGLPQGIANSLRAKLQNTEGALAAEPGGGRRGSACHMLDAFVNEVEAQVDKSVSAIDAAALIAAARRIQAVLGC